MDDNSGNDNSGSDNYNYNKIIKKPSELGIGKKDWRKDFSGVSDYINLMVGDKEGGGAASKICNSASNSDICDWSGNVDPESGEKSWYNKTLDKTTYENPNVFGNAFFLPSTLQCENEEEEMVNRQFYVDNRTGSNNFIVSTVESIGQLVEELPKMFMVFGEIGTQKCVKTEKTIVSQAENGSHTISKKKEYLITKSNKEMLKKKDSFRNINEMERFNIFDKSFKEKVPHFYVLTVGLFFTYMLFNLSLKKK